MWHRPLLALISPDQSYNDKHSLLVATIVQRPVIQDCIKQGGTKILETLPIQASWLMAYSECGNLTDSQTKVIKILLVRLSSKVPAHLNCGEFCTLKGKGNLPHR